MRYLFKFSGRIGRAEFWRGHLMLLALAVVWGLFMAGGFVLGLFTLAIGIGVLVMLLTAIWGGIGAAILLAGLCSLVVCRARDLGSSGWTALFLLIPGVNLLLWLYLGLAVGQPSGQETAP